MKTVVGLFFNMELVYEISNLLDFSVEMGLFLSCSHMIQWHYFVQQSNSVMIPHFTLNYDQTT